MYFFDDESERSGRRRANPSTIPLKIHRVIKGLYPVASKTGFITGEKVN